jgi:hypothetical protein
MGLLSLISPLLAKNTKFVESDFYGTEGEAIIDIDATISMTSNMTATASSSPIEDGSLVTDNVVLNNRMLNINDAIIQKVSLTTLSIGSNPFANRAKDGYDLIKEYWENKIPFTVITKLDRFSPVVITSFVPRNSAEVGDSLRFSITLEELQIVESLEIILPAKDVVADAQSGTSEVNQGKKAVSGASEGLSERGSSAAADIWTYFGNPAGVTPQ